MKKERTATMRNWIFAAISALALTTSAATAVHQAPAQHQNLAAGRPPATASQHEDLAWGGRAPAVSTDRPYQTAAGYDYERPETDQASPNGSANA
jgi:hypothetical protein